MDDSKIIFEITNKFRKNFKVEAVEEICQIKFDDELNELKKTLNKKQLLYLKNIENNFLIRLHCSIHQAITYSYFVTKSLYKNNKK